MINRNYRIARGAWVAAGVFFVCMVLAFYTMEGMSGGYAVSFLSGFAVIAAAITALVFRSLGREQDRILKGDDILVHWTYPRDFWSKYVEMDYRLEKAYKKTLFFIVAAFAIFFGVVFPLFDPESGIFVTYAMVALIAVIGVVAYASVAIPHRRNRTQGGEAFVSKRGVYLNGEMHSWSVAGMSLVHVAFVDAEEPHYIEFVYAGGTSEYSVRVPVPEGEDGKAREVVAEFA